MDDSTTESNIEALRSMRRQEEHYRVSDYLSELPPPTDPNTVGDGPVDASCRFAMGKWFNEVADAVRFQRETVAATMNYLDRFMASPSGKQILLDRDQYQLAAMTALYSNLKIHENESMELNHVSTLSRGAHSAEAVKAMEIKMLMAVRWRMYQPTSMSFVRKMIDSIPDQYFFPYEKEAILDVAKFQIELTIIEYEFCTHDPSSVALACLLNAIESVTGDCALSCSVQKAVGELFIGANDASIRRLRRAVYGLVNCDEDGMRRSEHSATEVNSVRGGAGVALVKGNNIHSSPCTVTATTTTSAPDS